MTSTKPSLHHVVFATELANLDMATKFLTEVGFEFQAFELEQLGLHVRLDWEHGIELIAPAPAAPRDPGSAADFLATHGEGVFSVILRVPDSASAEQTAERYGTKADFRQSLEGDGTSLSEVKLQPLFGMPLTLLMTNLD